MRKTVRLFSAVGPAERLGRAIVDLPSDVQRTLADVADRTDLPLVAGSWRDDDAGCLVANAVACVATPARATDGDDADESVPERTLDLRMLDAFPQMSSRDLNLLICAWDEAAAQADATTDDGLRALLRSGLAWAGIAPRYAAAPPPGGIGDGAEVMVTVGSGS
ncbi:MAG TPA: hypothetical protein VK923_00140 [Euzebyales bacterium]|nr:hypothetical protein [Euzebyales bacterium]